MRKLLVACLTALLSAAPIPAADAHPSYHYSGGCDLGAISDGSNDVRTTWEGVIAIAAVATDASRIPALVGIDVECELRINGYSAGFFLDAHGTAVAANARQISLNADPDDVVSICEHVTVGWEYHLNCGDASSTPLVPHFVYDAVDNSFAELCVFFAGQEGGPLDQPPAFDIRSGGDIYSFDEWVWDCTSGASVSRHYVMTYIST